MWEPPPVELDPLDAVVTAGSERSVDGRVNRHLKLVLGFDDGICGLGAFWDVPKALVVGPVLEDQSARAPHDTEGVGERGPGLSRGARIGIGPSGRRERASASTQA